MATLDFENEDKWRKFLSTIRSEKSSIKRPTKIEVKNDEIKCLAYTFANKLLINSTTKVTVTGKSDSLQKIQDRRDISSEMRPVLQKAKTMPALRPHSSKLVESESRDKVLKSEDLPSQIKIRDKETEIPTDIGSIREEIGQGDTSATLTSLDQENVQEFQTQVDISPEMQSIPSNRTNSLQNSTSVEYNSKLPIKREIKADFQILHSEQTKTDGTFMQESEFEDGIFPGMQSASTPSNVNGRNIKYEISTADETTKSSLKTNARENGTGKQFYVSPANQRTANTVEFRDGIFPGMQSPSTPSNVNGRNIEYEISIADETTESSLKTNARENGTVEQFYVSPAKQKTTNTVARETTLDGDNVPLILENQSPSLTAAGKKRGIQHESSSEITMSSSQAKCEEKVIGELSQVSHMKRKKIDTVVQETASGDRDTFLKPAEIQPLSSATGHDRDIKQESLTTSETTNSDLQINVKEENTAKHYEQVQHLISEIEPQSVPVVQGEIQLHRQRERVPMSPRKRKSDIDISCSQWNMSMLASYFDFDSTVATLTLDEDTEIPQQMKECKSVIRREINKRTELLSGNNDAESISTLLKEIRTNETTVRLLLDAIFIPLCSELGLRIEVKKRVECSYLVPCEFDYRILHAGNVIGCVEAKSATGFSKNSIVQAVLQLTILQAEALQSGQVECMQPFFNIVTDGLRWIFIQLEGEKLKFEHTRDRKLSINKMEKIKDFHAFIPKLLSFVHMSSGEAKSDSDEDVIDLT